MKKILVVDDTKVVLKVAKLILGDKYEVFLADSGDLALEILDNQPIDLVLMDIDMPKMDGLETTRRIRLIEDIKDIPIICFTGVTDGDIVQQCIAEGMVDYVVKPYKPEDLLARVKKHFAKTTYMPPVRLMKEENQDSI